MTDELKKAIESAHTEEEKKAVAEKFKDEMKELSPEELEGVAGGVAATIEKLQTNGPQHRVNIRQCKECMVDCVLIGDE